MRIFCILIMCIFMLFTSGCTASMQPEVDYPHMYQPPHITQVIRQQSFVASYQQWVILGTYVLTTIVMAIYTNKRNKKASKDAKSANQIYKHSKWSSNIILNLMRVLFRKGK